MKPIKAKDLLELDERLKVVKLQCYPIPEQVIWQAGKGDYSEVPIHEVALSFLLFFLFHKDDSVELIFQVT